MTSSIIPYIPSRLPRLDVSGSDQLLKIHSHHLLLEMLGVSNRQHADLVAHGAHSKQHEACADDEAEPKGRMIFNLNERQHLVIGPLSHGVCSGLKIACGQSVTGTVLLRNVRVRTLMGECKVEPLREEATMERHCAPAVCCNA